MMMMMMCETSAQLLHSRSGADLSPAHATPHSLVPCTHRPLGYQRMRTKRLTLHADTLPMPPPTYHRVHIAVLHALIFT